MSLYSTYNIVSKFSLLGYYQSKNTNIITIFITSFCFFQVSLPVQISPPVNVNIWEPLNEKGLHFVHININSLLPKIDELKCIANKTKAAIGITESTLDHTVRNHAVNFPGYDILRCDRNRNGGGVAC